MGTLDIPEEVIQLDFGLPLHEHINLWGMRKSFYFQRFEYEHGRNILVSLIYPVIKNEFNTPPPQIFLLNLINQTSKDFQLVVVDGGKNEEFTEMLKNMQNLLLHRLKVVQTNTSNIFEMLNEGLRAAQGEYIIFLDNESIFTNNFVEFFYSIAKENTADIVHTSKYAVPIAVKESNAQMNIYIRDSEKIFTESNEKEYILDEWLKWQGNVKIRNKIIRRAFLLENNIEFSANVYMPEWIFYLKCLCLVEKYVVIEDVFYIQLGSENAEKPAEIHKMIDGIEVIEKFIGSVFTENPELRQKILLAYMKNFLK